MNLLAKSCFGNSCLITALHVSYKKNLFLCNLLTCFHYCLTATLTPFKLHSGQSVLGQLRTLSVYWVKNLVSAIKWDLRSVVTFGHLIVFACQSGILLGIRSVV